MLKLHRDWVHSHRGAKVPEHSFYRYFHVVDDEVINHQLQLPMPAKHEKTIPAGYAIKSFDAWFNTDWDFYGDYSEPESEPSEEDEDMSDEEEEEEETEMARADDFIDDEGWFWIDVIHLVSFWMCEHDSTVEELSTSEKSWGDRKAARSCRYIVPGGGMKDEEQNAETMIFCDGRLDKITGLVHGIKGSPYAQSVCSTVAG